MPSLTDTPGLHHVTGIAGEAQPNVDFYVGTLGLRFLKRTVNFEDILAHHLYYGDAEGTTGSVLTFFPYGADVAPGRVGAPQPTTTALVVPPGSLEFWGRRLRRRGVSVEGPTERFDERVLSFRDPDGTHLELVTGTSSVEPWEDGPVPREYALRGLGGVTLRSVNPYATAGTLETLGFDLVGQEGDRVRYRASSDGPSGDRESRGRATVVDVLDRSEAYGREGPGTFHHVAVRVPDVDELYEWHDLFRERDYDVSRVTDRHFFHSLYVRGPGGILFELATEPDGDVGPSVGTPPLGDELYLPPRFEEDRELIESQLPDLRLPPEVEVP